MKVEKILIKTPNDRSEIIKSFPFIHQLKKTCVESEIYLLIDEENQDIFSFLELELSFFVLKSNYRNLPGAHKYAANTIELFNIDLYIDLEGSMFSSFLGFCFRGQSRLGPAQGLKKLFYTHKFDENNSPRSILKNEMKIVLSDEKIEAPEGKYEVPHGIFDGEEQPDSYLLFILTGMDLFENDFLKNFFHCFEDKIFKILLMGDKNSLFNEEKILETHKNFSSANKYYYNFNTEKNGLLHLVAESKGVITDNSFYAYLCNYHHVDSLIVGSQKKLPRVDFKLSPMVLCMGENGPLSFLGPDEMMYNIDLTVVADEIHKIWSLE